MVLDRTVAYPAGGGQPADTGRLVGGGVTFTVADVRAADGVVRHLGAFEDGADATAFAVGAQVTARPSALRHLTRDLIFSEESVSIPVPAALLLEAGEAVEGTRVVVIKQLVVGLTRGAVVQVTPPAHKVDFSEMAGRRGRALAGGARGQRAAGAARADPQRRPPARRGDDQHRVWFRCAGTGQGRAVQVEPIKHTLKAPGPKYLKLEYDKLLSTFAFKFNSRRFTEGQHAPHAAYVEYTGKVDGGAIATRPHTVCSLCTDVPVQTRAILLPGLANRSFSSST